MADAGSSCEMNRRQFGFGLVGASALSSCATIPSNDDASDYEEEIVSSIELELEELRRHRSVEFRDTTLQFPKYGFIELPSSGFALSPQQARDESFINTSGTYRISAETLRKIPNVNTKYWSIPVEERIKPAWIKKSAAPDYGHLSSYGEVSDSNFELNAKTLDFLCSRNSFKLFDSQRFVMFGLRGALPLRGEWSPYSANQAMIVTTPDHINCRCTIGIWDRESGKIALAKASTVPEAQSVFASLETQGLGTSLLPTGLYSYKVGTHKSRNPRRKQPGSFILNQWNYLVLRSPDDLQYDPFQENEVWTIGAAHNIHSGGPGNRNPLFYSAGCQVVPGYYLGTERQRSTGVWKQFREALGVVDKNGEIVESKSWSNPIPYVLLTGFEAALHYHKTHEFEASYWRLRPGSSGNTTRNLQERLFSELVVPGARASGVFDTKTGFAALRKSKIEHGEFTSPIVTTHGV